MPSPLSLPWDSERPESLPPTFQQDKQQPGPPEPALTHVLLEGIGGEQRHLVDARALIAAIWLRLGSCSRLGDSAAAASQTDRVQTRPRTSAPAFARLPPDGTAPGTRAAPSHSSRCEVQQLRRSSQRPCRGRSHREGRSSPCPRTRYRSGVCPGHLSIARTAASHGARDLRGGSCRAQIWATPESLKKCWRWYRRGHGRLRFSAGDCRLRQPSSCSF